MVRQRCSGEEREELTFLGHTVQRLIHVAAFHSLTGTRFHRFVFTYTLEFRQSAGCYWVAHVETWSPYPMSLPISPPPCEASSGIFLLEMPGSAVSLLRGWRAMPTPPSSSRPAPTEALLWGTTGILGGGGGGRYWAGWGTAGRLLAGGSWGGSWAAGPGLLTSTGPTPKPLAGRSG